MYIIFEIGELTSSPGWSELFIGIHAHLADNGQASICEQLTHDMWWRSIPRLAWVI